MEEIIIKKKNNAMIGEKIEKKKILFYNSCGEILIYEGSNGIIVPNFLITSGSSIENSIYDKMGMIIDENLLQELIKFIWYEEGFNCINGKLKKINIETISEYYSYYTSFNSDIISSIIETTSDLDLKPNLISISDFLHNNISNHPSHQRHKLAVEELDKRLRYVKY